MWRNEEGIDTCNVHVNTAGITYSVQSTCMTTYMYKIIDI